MDNIIKPKVKKEKVVFYLDPDEKKALKKVAIDLNTSASNIMASLVSNYLESVQ